MTKTAMDRRVFLASGAAALSGCARTTELVVSDAPIANTRQVLVATTRAASGDMLRGFGESRSHRLSFAEYGIAIPPDRKPGEIKLPRKKPDARTEFLTASQVQLDGSTHLKRRVTQALSAHPRSNGTVFVFVHGYNVPFPAAVFRAAQIAEDFDLDSPLLLYSWPSAGKLTRYVEDRDSALFGRRGLAETLRLLADSPAKKIVIIAHSMGGLLTMETMRTLEMIRDRKVLAKVSAVVLAEPDVDFDLFSEQIRPFDLSNLAVVVIGSHHDRALKVSSFVAGGHPRVGSAVNVEELRRMGVIVIDVSKASGDTALGHTAFSRSPELLSIIASGELAHAVLSASAGDDILVGTLNAAGNAAIAVAHLPYLIIE